MRFRPGQRVMRILDKTIDPKLSIGVRVGTRGTVRDFMCTQFNVHYYLVAWDVPDADPEGWAEHAMVPLDEGVAEREREFDRLTGMERDKSETQSE